jgi:hypothetical protein
MKCSVSVEYTVETTAIQLRTDTNYAIEKEGKPAGSAGSAGSTGGTDMQRGRHGQVAQPAQEAGAKEAPARQWGAIEAVGGRRGGRLFNRLAL